MGLLHVFLGPSRRRSVHKACWIWLDILQCGDLPFKYCSETSSCTLASLILLHKCLAVAEVKKLP